MKRTALWIALMFSASVSAAPWIYRGTLNDGGVPANGRYDIRLSLLDASGAKSLAYPLTFSNVEVKHGAFVIDVDFGMDLAQFGALKLKTEVAQGGSGFVALGEPKAFDAKAALGSVCWDTAGNAGLTVLDFIGTTDNAPVTIRANSDMVAQFGVPNGVGATNIVLGSPSNIANAQGATISGGGNDSSGNSVSGNYGSVAGGAGNVVGGSSGTIGGGSSNIASGVNSTVTGGFANCAGGDYSWAGGDNSRVRPGNESTDLACQFGGTSGDANGDEGTFIWSDTTVPLVSTGPNQFLVRADGGVGINDTPPNANGGFEFSIYGNTPDNGFVELSLIPKLSLNGNTGERIELGVGPGGAGNNDASFRIAHRNNSGGYFERVLLNPTGSVEIRSSTSNAAQGVTMAAGGGSWSSLSDRNVKTAVAPADARAVLDKLVAMPVSEWSYIAQGEGVRHIGPMAQDFAAAKSVGENDTTISTVDADGVALAAIKGLNAKLEAENATLKSQLSALADRLARLEAAQAR